MKTPKSSLNKGRIIITFLTGIIASNRMFW